MAIRSPSVSDALDLKLTSHRALIFDVYGTLIDWESAIHDALVHVFPDLPREKILADYSGVERNLQMQFQSMPYRKVLEQAYRQLASLSDVTTAGIVEGERRMEQRGSTSDMKDMFGSPSPACDDAACFGRSIEQWQPFTDTVDGLHRLKKHFALVVLSNIDDESFAWTHEKLCSPGYPASAYRTVTPDSPFSLILTAQQIGAYKPNLLMLESALRQLSTNPDPTLPSNPSVRVDASGVLVVANSLHHDIIPAMRLELQSVWISRHGVNFIGNESQGTAPCSDQVGEGKVPYTWRYETLGGMANAVEEEV